MSSETFPILAQALVFGWGARGERPRSPRRDSTAGIDRQGNALHAPRSVIEIVSVAGLATIQDAGRPGHMHEGVPPGGAMAPLMLARANIAARNRPDAAG